MSERAASCFPTVTLNFDSLKKFARFLNRRRRKGSGPSEEPTDGGSRNFRFGEVLLCQGVLPTEQPKYRNAHQVPQEIVWKMAMEFEPDPEATVYRIFR
jgi:hypothetical protein